MGCNGTCICCIQYNMWLKILLYKTPFMSMYLTQKFYSTSFTLNILAVHQVSQKHGVSQLSCMGVLVSRLVTAKWISVDIVQPKAGVSVETLQTRHLGWYVSISRTRQKQTGRRVLLPTVTADSEWYRSVYLCGCVTILSLENTGFKPTGSSAWALLPCVNTCRQSTVVTNSHMMEHWHLCCLFAASATIRTADKTLLFTVFTKNDKDVYISGFSLYRTVTLKPSYIPNRAFCIHRLWKYCWRKDNNKAHSFSLPHSGPKENVGWWKADQTIKLQKTQMTAVNAGQEKKEVMNSENACLTSSTSGMPQQFRTLEAIEKSLAYCAFVVRKDIFTLLRPRHVLLPSLFSHLCCYSAQLLCNSLSHWPANMTVHICTSPLQPHDQQTDHMQM